jgi:thioredoxin reductase (NADPH)
MSEARDRDRLFPKLADVEIARLARRGERRPMRRGEVLWEVGAPRIDFYLVLSGSIEIVQPRAGETTRPAARRRARYGTSSS